MIRDNLSFHQHHFGQFRRGSGQLVVFCCSVIAGDTSQNSNVAYCDGSLQLSAAQVQRTAQVQLSWQIIGRPCGGGCGQWLITGRSQFRVVPAIDIYISGSGADLVDLYGLWKRWQLRGNLGLLLCTFNRSNVGIDRFVAVLWLPVNQNWRVYPVIRRMSTAVFNFGGSYFPTIEGLVWNKSNFLESSIFQDLH